MKVIEYDEAISLLCGLASLQETASQSPGNERLEASARIRGAIEITAMIYEKSLEDVKSDMEAMRIIEDLNKPQ